MSPVVERLMPHLVVIPILLPMLSAAVMLCLGEGRRPIKSALGFISGVLSLCVVSVLAWWVHTRGPIVYLPGNWRPPYGIALVADRLSVMMLLLAVLVGLGAKLFASARWDKAGVHFHPLAQLQLMGLAGAFLTGDLFNLFVFFEILLAASYGLLLHGSGRPRVSASVHYVAINIASSALFLLGATTLYGVTGTLNMADLSLRVLDVTAADRWLLHVGAGLLAVAFLVKAAAWPLNAWLVPAYSAATAPVAGFFALLTKVGVYALIRMWTLLFAQSPAQEGGSALFAIGLVTALLGGLGMLGSQRLSPLAGYSVIVSSGTLMAALGLGRWELTGGALYYLASSTLAVSALFLLIDLVERWRNLGATREDEAPFLSIGLMDDENVNLDDDEERLVGRAIPASTAFLALAFMACTLLIAGLPPLSSFVGKVAMLSAAVGVEAPGGAVPVRAWLFLAVLLTTGLLSLMALTRAGIRNFWATSDREGPRLRLAEGLPVVLLLATTVAITVAAGPLLAYTGAAARALHSPSEYIQAVLGAHVLPGVTKPAPTTGGAP